MSKREVSRRVLIRPDKVGTEVRSALSASAIFDRITSDAVEETRSTVAYVRRSPPRSYPPPPIPSAPVMDYDSPPPPIPSAPVVDHDNPPSTPRKHRHDSNPYTTVTPSSHGASVVARVFFAATIIFTVGVVAWHLSRGPVEDVLIGASWQVTGKVEEYRIVQGQGWELPLDLVELLSNETRQHSTQNIIDHYTTVCKPKTEKHQVLDGTDTICAPVQVGTTEPLEIYSHTEELCYDDGSCEEKDVYIKEPAKPVMVEQCHTVPRYREVLSFRDECHQEPVYRAEPVMASYYTYRHYAWVFNRTIDLSGTAPETPVPSALPLLERSDTPLRYSDTAWRFVLVFKKHGVRKVSKELYLVHSKPGSLGQTIEVPS